jgi:hypothetical protein
MYKSQQADAGGAAPATDGSGKPEDNVVDADFEEIDDNKKGAA